jgi:hypothetical protein
MSGITVPQVFAAMGITPDNHQAWSAGARVAAMYVEQFGCQPPKDNRPKTRGGGSHCFAIYPATWERRIRAVITEIVQSERDQLGLF